jgi:3-hydroxyacyl-[acyl-carrier-protein] dehydratase
MSADPRLALESLPHGPEFRFIDRLLDLAPGQSAVGEFAIRPDAYYLRGHFPGNPLMPGVLLIEACAQLAGIAAQSDPVIGALPNLRLTAVRQAKIMGTARPGETILIEATIRARLGNLIHADSTASLQGKTIASVEITLAGM